MCEMVDGRSKQQPLYKVSVLIVVFTKGHHHRDRGEQRLYVQGLHGRDGENGLQHKPEDVKHVEAQYGVPREHQEHGLSFGRFCVHGIELECCNDHRQVRYGYQRSAVSRVCARQTLHERVSENVIREKHDGQRDQHSAHGEFQFGRERRLHRFFFSFPVLRLLLGGGSSFFCVLVLA